MDNLYTVMGIEPSASADEVAIAFGEQKRRLQALMKGGAGTDLEEEAAQMLQALFQAHKILGDPAKRVAYDADNGFAAAPTATAPVAAPAQSRPAVQGEPELGQSAFRPRARKERAVEPLWIAVNNEGPIYLDPKMANRHGLIAGATGTGKTVTLKVLAEHFSNIGVPVFLADIKGDVWSMYRAGEDSAGLQKRLHGKLGLPESYKVNFQGYPMRFWDVYGQKGHPVRTTISEMGPNLLARLLELNETQAGVLNIVFRYADDNELLILDMKDLRTMVKYCADHADEITTRYGNISTQSVGAIQRALLSLEDSGGNIFFGERALDLNDWFDYDEKGRGVINLLHCAELFQHPVLYSTFLLWMLSGLYDLLPEKGDADKPEIVFFFDEAHLIFKEAPKSLLAKVEQIVRLIRSKGVGVYFITQLPSDIPNSVLGQLGNKVQHALRAYTPKDQQALKSTAQSFRANPKLDAEKALAELGTGEALVSFINAEGAPSIVQRAYIMPPESYLGVCDESERQQLLAADEPYYEKYKEAFDRLSAYEVLSDKIDEAQSQAKLEAAMEAQRKQQELDRKEAEKQEKANLAAQREAERQAEREAREAAREQARLQREEEAARRQAEREAARLQKEEEAARKLKEREDAKAAKERTAMVKSALSFAKSGAGNSIIRGIFGMLKK